MSYMLYALYWALDGCPISFEEYIEYMEQGKKQFVEHIRKLEENNNGAC